MPRQIDDTTQITPEHDGTDPQPNAAPEILENDEWLTRLESEVAMLISEKRPYNQFSLIATILSHIFASPLNIEQKDYIFRMLSLEEPVEDERVTDSYELKEIVSLIIRCEGIVTSQDDLKLVETAKALQERLTGTSNSEG